MTNREKFFEVFKCLPEFGLIEWDDKYFSKGLKKYEVRMYDYMPGRRKKEYIGECIDVYAGNKDYARKQAVIKFGSAYKRWATGKPMYALEIKEIGKI